MLKVDFVEGRFFFFDDRWLIDWRGIWNGDDVGFVGLLSNDGLVGARFIV